ncbi:HTH_Tnp_Tc3_2 domain-containing protein [Trichonephila clavipes]|nr:HTH_Tnp_Tc3_2 domain-containing protein [Trichonephila clavipes]
MPLRRHRKQYEQLFKRGRIIGIIEARWSTWRVTTHQVGRSDLTVTDQWTEEASFSQRAGSGCLQQTNHQEDRPIIRHARLEPTASLAAVQAQVEPLL